MQTTQTMMDQAFAELHLIRYCAKHLPGMKIISDPISREVFRRIYAADLADPKERTGFLDTILSEYAACNGSEEERWKIAVENTLCLYSMLLIRAEQLTQA